MAGRSRRPARRGTRGPGNEQVRSLRRAQVQRARRGCSVRGAKIQVNNLPQHLFALLHLAGHFKKFIVHPFILLRAEPRSDYIDELHLAFAAPPGVFASTGAAKALLQQGQCDHVGRKV